MKSIRGAMTWELYRVGRWGFLLSTLGSIAFPSVVLAALHSDGLAVNNDPSMLTLQVIMLQVGMFCCGAAALGAYGRMSRLYSYPVRTTELVTWRMLPMMAAVALQMIVVVGTLNYIFGLQWPIWGPALFGAASIAAVVSVSWLMDRSVGWIILGLTIVAAVLSLWFQSRFGPAVGNPTHTWQHLTSGEMLTMLTTAAICYSVAVAAVARNRRGEPPISIGFIDWLNSAFELCKTRELRLDTPIQAQCWLHWRRRGRVIPLGCFALIVLGLIAWSVESLKANDLFQMFFIGGHMMWTLGIIGGILMGNVGTHDSNYTMGHFAATRPLTDVNLSWVVLRTAIVSISLTWLIWALAFSVVCVGIVACGASAAIRLPEGWNWWLIPITLLGPWMVAGTIMPLLLVGRPNMVVRLACVFPAMLIILIAISKLALMPGLQAIFDRAITIVAAAIFIASGIWAYVVARRRRLIQKTAAWSAAIAALATTICICYWLPNDLTPFWMDYLLIAAAVSTVASPLATVPLAISANRHR